MAADQRGVAHVVLLRTDFRAAPGNGIASKGELMLPGVTTRAYACLMSIAMDEVSEIRHLEQCLASMREPAAFDVFDETVSTPAIRRALIVLHRTQAIVNPYISTASNDAHEERKLPETYLRIVLAASALGERAFWLQHAWMCNMHGMTNARPYVGPVVLDDALGGD